MEGSAKDKVRLDLKTDLSLRKMLTLDVQGQGDGKRSLNRYVESSAA